MHSPIKVMTPVVMDLGRVSDGVIGIYRGVIDAVRGGKTQHHAGVKGVGSH